MHVFGVMDRGGAEVRTLALMRHVDPAHYVMEYIALSGNEGALDDEIRSLGGEVHPCALDATFPVRFVRLLHARRIGVVHSHVHLATGMILGLAALAGVSVRIAHFRTTQDGRGDSPARRLYRRIMRMSIDRFATDILACGVGAMEYGWSPDWRADPRCRVILNGVDATRFDLPGQGAVVRQELSIPHDSPLVLIIGRFAPVKNHVRGIEIFSEIALRTGAHLLLAGKGGTAEEDLARRRVASLGLEARVHFLGERDDVASLLCAADLALLTSHHEGMPGAVLEAVAAGTPVLATDLPGVREIQRCLDGISTLSLADPDVAWAELACKLIGAPRSDSSRRVARSSFRASPFAIERSVEGHVDVWKQGRG
ncbi:MAG: glycosyltransferase [Kofleriaceae bacterium]|nr:glycosyltransferase [Myxococcales bacterium]MCB9559553.1 glycosyltransferase [Kofleriaceae bacterium]